MNNPDRKEVINIETAQQTPYGVRILMALQGKPIYPGTKSQNKGPRKAKRLRAKAARKVNRG